MFPTLKFIIPASLRGVSIEECTLTPFCLDILAWDFLTSKMSYFHAEFVRYWIFKEPCKRRYRTGWWKMPGRVDGFWGSGSRPLGRQKKDVRRLLMSTNQDASKADDDELLRQKIELQQQAKTASEGNVWGLKHTSSMLKPVAISAKNMYQSLGIRVSLHVANEHVCEYTRINFI